MEKIERKLTHKTTRNRSQVGSLITGRVISAIAQGAMVLGLTQVEPPKDLGITLALFSVVLVFSGVTDFGFTTLILTYQKHQPAISKKLLGLDTSVSLLMAFFRLLSYCLFVDNWGSQA